MPKKKSGKYYLIDYIEPYRFIEVLFDGEDRPLYKIYDGSTPVDYWRSDVNLHALSDSEIFDSDDYQKFLDFFLDEEPDAELDMFGLPVDSKVGTAEGNVEMPQNQSAPVSSKQKVSNRFTNNYNNSNYFGYYNYKPEVEDENKVAELSKSNTIVFHLEDHSTEMLGQIYDGKGYDVVRHRLNTPTVRALMNRHERIICLGHGSGFGLIGMFGTEVRDCFKDKKIFTIWCNADRYFNDGGVGQGAFITGNMPSEVWECRAAGCGNISRELMLENITYWSKLCADKVEDCLAGNVRESVDYIRREYISKYGDHPVTHYNSVRTFVLGDSYDQAEKEVKAIEDELGIHPNWQKYNDPNYTADTKADNKELERGIALCVNLIERELNIVNGKNEFDLKRALQADDSFYTYVGNVVIDRLVKTHPDIKFKISGSIISWE